mmetsp:Transcript_54477/g.63678  ORF Transcript_54477/g.63678 Transcript_54477/m.63678 type:complete len:86 (+) Transcript_54477:675-932(+)
MYLSYYYSSKKYMHVTRNQKLSYSSLHDNQLRCWLSLLPLPLLVSVISVVLFIEILQLGTAKEDGRSHPSFYFQNNTVALSLRWH